jgi:prepilin-type N-terminal cleavage/methylation domain-containing protein
MTTSRSDVIPTGRSGADARQGGYTLMELLAVIAILGLMLMIAVTRIDFLIPKYRVRAAGRELGAYLQHVKGRAVAEGMPFYVCYDVPGRKYWVLAPLPIPPEELEMMGLAAPGGGLPLAGAGLPVPGLPPPPGPPPIRYGEALVTALPDDVIFKDVAVGTETMSGFITIEITPFGSTRTHYVHLSDEAGDRKTTIKFNGLTGNVTFYDGYLPPSESVMEAD